MVVRSDDTGKKRCSWCRVGLVHTAGRSQEKFTGNAHLSRHLSSPAKVPKRLEIDGLVCEEAGDCGFEQLTKSLVVGICVP